MIAPRKNLQFSLYFWTILVDDILADTNPKSTVGDNWDTADKAIVYKLNS